MSAKLMGQVFDLKLPPDLAWVLMAFLDHADHEGRHIRPSISLIQWKTNLSTRKISSAVKELCDLGLLVVDNPGGGRGNPTEYHADLSQAPLKPPRIRSAHEPRNPAQGAGFTKTPQNDPGNPAETLHQDAETNSPDAQNERGTVNQLTLNHEDIERWEKIRNEAKHHMTRATWEGLLLGAQLVAASPAALTVRAPSTHAAWTLSERYHSVMQTTTHAALGRSIAIEWTA